MRNRLTFCLLLSFILIACQSPTFQVRIDKSEFPIVVVDSKIGNSYKSDSICFFERAENLKVKIKKNKLLISYRSKDVKGDLFNNTFGYRVELDSVNQKVLLTLKNRSIKELK